MATTIDNKTVQMNFDNSNFERNISQSMDSLKQMDGQLQNMEKSKSLETLNNQAKKVDFSHMSKGLNDVKVHFSALQVAGATVISELTKKVMAFGSNLAKNTVGQIKSGGITRALNLDQAEFQIKGLGKTWSKIIQKGGKETEVGIKRDVLNAVSGTQYGLDEAAKIASQLLSSNVKQGKELEGVLRSIAGVASMTNSSYADMGNLYAKVAGNGRMMSQELLQLSARGLNAAAIMRDYINANDGVRKSMIAVGKTSKGKGKEVAAFAKKTKLTEQDVRTLASAGAIDFKNFAKAMEKSFGKAASKANETYAGSLANVKAALSRIGADVAVPLYTRDLRKTFVTLIDVIDDFHEALSPLINLIDKTSKKTFKNIRKFVKDIDMEKVGNAIKTVTKILDSFINTVTTSFKKVYGVVKAQFEVLYATIKDTLKKIFNVSDILGGSNKVVSAFGKLIEWLGNVFARTLKIVNSIVKILTPVLVPAIQTIFGLLKGLGNFVLNFLTNISNGLTQNESVFIRWATNIATLFNTIKPVFSALWNLASAVFDALMKTVNDLFGTFKDSKSKGFDTFIDGLKSVITVVSSVINKIAELIRKTEVIQAIGMIISSIIKGIGYVLTHLGTVIGKLLKGIGNFFSKIKEGIRLGDTLKTIMDTLKKGISDVIAMLNQNGDVVLRGSVFALLFVKIKQLVFALQSLQGKGLIKYARPIQQIFTNLGTTINKFNNQIRYKTLKEIAISILMLSVALMILSGIPKDKLTTSITTIMTLFYGLTKSFKSISSVGAFKMGPVVRVLLSVAVAVSILASAVRKISELKTDELIRGMVGISILLAEIVATIKILSAGTGKLSGGVLTILAIAQAVKMLSGAVASLGNISWDSMLRGLSGVGLLLVEVAGFMTLTSLVDKKIGKVSLRTTINILAVAKAITILAGAVALLGGMSWDELAKGLTSVGALMASIVGYMALTALIGKKIGNSSLKASIAILVTVKSIEILAKVVKSLSSLSWMELARGLAAVAGMMVSLIGFTALLNKVGGMSLKSAAGILIVALAMKVLADVVSVLGSMNLTQLIAGMIAFVAILGSLAVALNAMKGTLSGSAALVAASVGILLLAGALKLISTIPIPALIASIVAMAGALLVLYLAVYTLGGAIPSILALGVAVGVFGAGIALLGIGLLACVAALDMFIKLIVHVGEGLKDILIALVTAVVESVKALIIGIADMIPQLIKTLVVIVKGIIQIFREVVPELAKAIVEMIDSVLKTLAQNIGPIITSCLDIIIAIINGIANRVGELTSAIGNLLGEIGKAILNAINGIDPAKIYQLLFTVTLVAAVFTVLAYLKNTMKKAVKSIAIMSIGLVMLTGVFALMSLLPNDLSGKLDSISKALISIGVTMFICSKIPANGALAAIKVIAIFVAGLLAILLALGGIKQIPGVSWLLSEGTKLLAQLGNAIGEFIGSIIKGIVVQASNALPTLGKNLSKFMDGFSGFLDGIKKVDGKSVWRTMQLVAIIGLLLAEATWSDLLSGVEGIMSALGIGGKDTGIEGLLKKVSSIGEALIQFSKDTEGLNTKDIKSKIESAAILIETLNRIPKSGGLLQVIVGVSDYDGFAKGIESIAKAIETVKEKFKNLTKQDVQNVNSIITLISGFTKAMDKVPKKGLLDIVIGFKDYDYFADGIESISDAIKSVKKNFKGLTKKDVQNVTSVIELISDFTEALEKVPKKFGLSQFFTGWEDYQDFSKGIKDVSKAIYSVKESFKDLTKEDISHVTSVIGFVSDFAKSLDKVPNSFGIAQIFTGQENYGYFASGIKSISKAIKSVKNSFKDVSKEDFKNVNEVISLIAGFTKAADSIPNSFGIAQIFTGQENYGYFASGITAMGNAIKTVKDKFKDVSEEDFDKTKTVIKLIGQLANMTDNIPKIGIFDLFTGITDYTGFANGIVAIGSAISQAKEYFSEITDEDLLKTQNAVKMILELSKAANEIPKVGIFDIFTGITDYDGFKHGVEVFCDVVSSVKDKFSDVGDDDISKTEKVVNIIAKLSKSMEGLPTIGLFDIFTGVTDYNSMPRVVEAFATVIKGVKEKFADVEDEDISKTSKVVKIIASLCKAVKDLPEITIFDKFTGVKDYDSMPKAMGGFAKVVTTVKDKFKDVDDAIFTKLEKSVNCISTLSKAAADLPETTIFDKFTGKTDYTALPKAMNAFAKVMNTVKVDMKDVGDEDLDRAKKMVDTISLLAKASKDMPESSVFDIWTGYTDYDGFVNGMVSVAAGVIAIGKLDIGNASLKNAKTIADIIATIVPVMKDTKSLAADVKAASASLSKDSNEITNITTNLTAIKTQLLEGDFTYKTNGIDGFIAKAKALVASLKTLSTDLKSIDVSKIETIKSKVESFGSEMIDTLTEKISGKKSTIVKATYDALKLIGQTATQYAPFMKSKFFKIGADLIQGMVNGINSKTHNVKKSLEFQIEAGVKVTKKKAESHSPSKVYERIGSDLMQGEINGVIKTGQKLQSALATVATNGIKATTKATKVAANKHYGDILGKAITGHLKYGTKEYVKAFVNAYASNIKSWNDSDLRDAALKVVHRFNAAAVRLYKETNKSGYDSDQKAIRDAKKEYNKAKRAYNKVKKYDKKSYKNSKDSNKKKKYKKAKSKKKTMKSKKKAWNKKKQDYKKNVNNTFNDLAKTIKDNAVTFLNPLKNAIDTGIDLFTKFERGQRVSAGRMLANMKSQIQASSDWAADLDKLKAKGLSETLLNKLREKGISGYQDVKTFLRMDASQIAEANKYADQEIKMSFSTMMSSLEARLGKATSWKEKIQKLVKKGVDKDAIMDLLKMGLDEAIPYLEALSTATDAELKKFNTMYRKAVATEKDISAEGMAAYVKSLENVESSGSSDKKKKTSKKDKKKTKKKDKKKTKKTKKKKTKTKKKGKKKISSKKTKLKSGLDTLGDGLAEDLDDTSASEVSENFVYSVAEGIEVNGDVAVSAAVTLGEGIKNALNDELSGETLSNNVVTALSDSLGSLGNLINSIDSTPTITPMLDLNRLENDLEELGNMFDSPYTLDIAASVSKSGSSAAQSTKSGDIINNYNNEFTQNNYSPEPLDRVGIYRDTKGWINSKMKGGVATT